MQNNLTLEINKLERLLENKKFSIADKLTFKIMQNIIEKDIGTFDRFHPTHAFNIFPCNYLSAIDYYWSYYSNGRFGFSRQKLIWDSVMRDWDQFCLAIGWMTEASKQDGIRGGYHADKHCGIKRIFDISALVGHLPQAVDYGTCLFHDTWTGDPIAMQIAIMLRIETCSILSL